MSDTLADIRARLKGGKFKSPVEKSATPPPTGVLPVQSSTEGRLAALETVVNELAKGCSQEMKDKLAKLSKKDWTRAQ